MNTPANTNHRIGSDVYIRDQDDQTIQFKARVFNIDYAAQEADIGLFPRRWGTFSELHLPDVYRVRVPLSELSLTPHPGTEQMGFEDRLLALGEKPPAWMDHAGLVHQPGCAEPTSAVTTVEAPDGTPEFSLAASSATPAVVEAVRTENQEAAKSVTEKAAEAAAAHPLAGKPFPIPPDGSQPSKQATKSGKKPPLFTKAEIMNQEHVVLQELTKLRNMLEAVL